MSLKKVYVLPHNKESLVTLVLFVCSLLLFPLPTNADVIYLKNGNKIKTSRAWREDGAVKCERFGGIISYPLSSVAKIEKKTSSPKAPKPKPQEKKTSDINYKNLAKEIIANEKKFSESHPSTSLSSHRPALEIARAALYMAASNGFDLSVRQDAIDQINQALLIDEKEPWIYLAQALIVIQSGYTIGEWYDPGSFVPGAVDQAIQIASKAVEFDPDFSEGYSFLAWFYLIKRDFPRVDALLDRAYELDQENFYAWLYRGTFALVLRHPEEAKPRFEEALKYATHPYQRGVIRGRIRDAFRMTGDLAGEEKYLQGSIQLEPNNAYAYGRYANFLMCHGRNKEAIPYWEKAISITPYRHAIERLKEAKDNTSEAPCAEKEE